jgi:hypothetical protein
VHGLGRKSLHGIEGTARLPVVPYDFTFTRKSPLLARLQAIPTTVMTAATFREEEGQASMC